MVFAIHWHESATGVHVSPHSEPPSQLPPHPIPPGCPRAPALSALLHTMNLHWWSSSHIVIYMFQCYSLISSHPCLLPHSPKVCSLHLCLFCCLAYKLIITVFLNFVSVHFSCSVMSDSLWPHDLEHARPPYPSSTPWKIILGWESERQYNNCTN